MSIVGKREARMRSWVVMGMPLWERARDKGIKRDKEWGSETTALFRARWLNEVNAYVARLRLCLLFVCD